MYECVRWNVAETEQKYRGGGFFFFKEELHWRIFSACPTGKSLVFIQ